MKFTVNDKTYFVKWKYFTLIDDNKNKRVHTWCRIYDNNSSFDSPIIQGEAIKVAEDRFCKNTGRKISLDRALRKLFPYSYHIQDIDGQVIVVPDEINVTHQEYRAIAWKEYFNESPKRLK